MWSLIPWKKDNQGGTLTAEPFEREFTRIRNEFDNLLQRMWGGLSAFGDDFFESRWGLDVDETETHYVARVPAPGFELGDFDVYVSGNHLVVKAEHKQSENEKNGSHYRYGRIQRTIPLPEGIEHDKINARYHNGMLELEIPKGQASQAKRIAVKAA
jgi:HSP20 family protein